MHCTYILLQNDGRLYAGQTIDLKNRLAEHLKGKVKSTKLKRPLRSIFYEAFASSADAKRRENYFKTTKGKITLRIMPRESLKQS